MTSVAPEPRPVRLTVAGIEHYGEWLNEARADGLPQLVDPIEQRPLKDPQPFAGFGRG